MSDVLIIGGGIVGLLSALTLTERGRHVTLVDDGKPHSASWAGGGILSPLYPWRYSAAMNQLTIDAVSRYEALTQPLVQAGLLREDVLQRGGLWLQAEPDEQRRALAWARALRFNARVQSAQTLIPASSLGNGIWLPTLANIRNPWLLAALRRFLVRQGVRFIRRRAVGLQASTAAPVVQFADGSRVAADKILVCAGFASADLLETLGISLPLFPAKGEMLLYALPPGRVPAVMLTDSGYMIPRADGALLVGSTLRKGDASPWPTVSGRYQLARLAERLLPELQGIRPRHHWAGVRPGCDRDHPYLGPVPGQHNVYAAVGHYRNGLAAAPASAELLAQMLTGEPGFIDPSPYALPASSRSSSSFFSR